MTKPAFEPIAVVGRACLLPGATTPEQLWQLVLEGRDVIGPAPEGRWGVAREKILAAAGASASDRAWSDRGGYVESFASVFDPEGFDGLTAAQVLALDPLFQWLLHTTREALRDAGGAHGRVGAVFGNLSFPSASMAAFAEAVWSDREARPDARNRFSSGLPALILEKALALEAGAFALDAACASSLYAIKSACDRLHDGRADLVLAGAVNCADDLFIHVGFTALGALSPSGRSRPFHAGADGLVPAEGAAFVALKRLADAERDGNTIHAVLRGVGLSNDGRGKGFLVPSEEGQTRAIRAAYEAASLSPSDISLLECHATGTTIGDATELRSLGNVFTGAAAALPIGSLKSNMGHLITAAGTAALIKVIEAMRAGVRPPTLHVETPTADLAGTPFRLLTAAEPWDVADGATRRAGISAFGFGGNNAHLLVEQYDNRKSGTGTSARETAVAPEPLAIVAIGVVAAGCRNVEEFATALRDRRSQLQLRDDGCFEGRAGQLVLDVAALGVPPSDLRQTLAQQLLMLGAAREAVANLESCTRLEQTGGALPRAGDRDGVLPRERSGVFVGMGVDAEVARYGMRWRNTSGDSADGVVGALTSAGVIGTMPNMTANRINRLFDLGGASCTVSAEERSGLVALEMAARALRLGELDAATMQDRLDHADIFVSAAIYEPFGLAVLEAAQAR
ncbi:MAG: beta-ketoacyl synthase N-terminal-like domain-containing protein, partial [Candidatus Binatia bacterium]